MEETKDIQAYVNVDNDGNIISAQIGENIIPTDAFHYFFIVDKKQASELSLYKVAIESMKPKLVLKNAE